MLDAVLDADNGYFQIENDEKFAEIFSILTEDGIFTPTRLVQGTIDGVAVFQSAMMTILADQIHRTVAVWIDDVVSMNYYKNYEKFLNNLKNLE
jgi:hypothetical protein